MKYITLANNKGISIIDDEDFELVSKHPWQILKNQWTPYAVSNETVNHKKISLRMHRLIMGAKKGEEVDHINGNGLDNRKSNLRICTRVQNARNAKPQKNTSSKYKGVSWSRHNTLNPWRAYINSDNKHIHLGCFNKEEDAARAYDAKAKELFGEFARLNFQEEA